MYVNAGLLRVVIRPTVASIRAHRRAIALLNLAAERARMWGA